ncbi:phosphoenolpyruvate--protein phosphotransferase [Mycoplasma anatis]|uniref:Phosphoenolpyruvate-protein phosphotransferase n=1 Tax=Mycoplasmopsis anatis TaxID=171279 RepID=A0A9Q3LA38_9BACT|nr:phosphoenolpyruvate--protein phosphotransferase [Mycoplasmopsis anatis]MBW0596282.1 phosphoenolpyruvate--protein phosphotransferase [Mycoplasmopsis anatis]MBW0596468.1 phosphoenolpyruvate--protein phosphotransferase [Mycoplasmopsis anatis]MBW0597781.1 phosphoenolpyruvate--protein phosphotransferase [Mycoplasmopsis anatis]MBW0600048.1 phosphoenolpyruvate--protein phosphotransferase [Mycoplasmopsis anatis]MBW0600659.1 phosphoenolpyruvate--protein phosphotransferase [Mycoplasmopsis anatis]
MQIKGIGASKGVALAKVLKIEEKEIKVNEKSSRSIEDETNLFNEAVKNVEEKIKKGKQMAKDPEHAEIFEAHLNFLNDPFTTERIIDMINQGYSSIYSVSKVYEENEQIFLSMDDEYMRERAADIRDIKSKLLYSLSGITEHDLSSISEEVVIVANDLTPSQTVQLNKEFVKGFVTNIGGPTSHTAIMARSLGIPSVVGTNNILEQVQDGDWIAINGEKGYVIINPNSTEKVEIAKQQKLYQEYLLKLKLFRGKESVTKDGHKVELAANIGSPNDLQSIIDNDAEAVGLFRSEFLYMDNVDWPSEDEQFEAYKKVVSGMNGKRVVIRTLDIGGDKTLKYFKFPEEMNPFLGYRAIRFCLQNEKIFKTQLRALIRASYYGKVAIMIPMITNVKEFLDAKKIFEETYYELSKETSEIAPLSEIEFGLMMETPAAAILSDKFCKYADFVSIGTNDLIQYSMAADRMNESISYLYQPLNPSIIRLIKHVIDGAHKNGKWAGMCGEMAGDRRALPILVGLGLDEFSMSASNILNTREMLSNLSLQKCKEIADKVLEMDTDEEVQEFLNKELK